jgi:hypothetical protein
MINDEIDQAEFELKMEVTLDEADKWWEDIDPEEKATIYIRNKDRDYMLDDEIEFLNLILKSNKGRDDCLIHMVKGRLDKLNQGDKR